jgi:hypothetical protein
MMTAADGGEATIREIWGAQSAGFRLRGTAIE